MRPQDLAQAVRRRPFEPFRIVLTEGTAYDIQHPELVMLGHRSAVVGIARPDAPEPFYDRYVTVDLVHIVRMEPLEKVSPKGNGPAAT